MSPAYEGMLKEEMDAAAARHPDVAYEPLLIDATYAGLITGRADTPLVIELRPSVVMAEAPHGTAPALEGKDVANPMAMILAAGALLGVAGESGDEAAARGSTAILDAVMGAAADGVRTSDLKGHAGTTEFTDVVIERVRASAARVPFLISLWRGTTKACLRPGFLSRR
ncbi:hypothetical protein BH20ACT15_BH20ACT15_14780 [soil metagenome]